MTASFLGISANLLAIQKAVDKDAPTKIPEMMPYAEIAFVTLEPEYLSINAALTKRAKVDTFRVDVCQDGLAHLIDTLKNLQIDLQAMADRLNLPKGDPNQPSLPL